MAYAPLVELFRAPPASVEALRLRLRELIAAGEPVDAPTDHPSMKTPLQLAASGALGLGPNRWQLSMAALEELIALGADVHTRHPRSGAQALHYAAKFGTAPIVRLLIEAGADPNQRDNEGMLPLYQSLLRPQSDPDRFDVFCALLELGADPRLKNATDRSLTQCVREDNFKREARRAILEWKIHDGVVFERGPEIESPDSSGRSSLGGPGPL